MRLTELVKRRLHGYTHVRISAFTVLFLNKVCSYTLRNWNVKTGNNFKLIYSYAVAMCCCIAIYMYKPLFM